MPRRKESLLDSLMAAGAAMPWWLSLILAAVAYFLLHQVATMDVPKASGLQDLGASAASQFYRTLATFAQYLVPCALLVGAVAAFIRRRRDVKLYDGTRRDSSAERIEKLSWRQFERLLGEAFRRQGYCA
ncbi:MAG: restriction endonuclease, partial [Gammaproteobacteria bacterium]|nr:restriction endonuclease [Gammaproteobacteria bacterium]